jgi:putative membrane-bound dehydrogenase-like protein
MAFGEPFVMKSASLVLWIAVSSATLGAAGVSASSPPQSLDSRLVFERIAAEPEIVTPTGIAVDQRGRILVVESHTHFRPAGYQGPPADRIRVFEDRDRDGKTECTGTFFEGTQKTMNVAVARDGSVFVATRSALYRLEDRDGDGRADSITGGKLPAPIIRLDTKGDYPHNGLSGFAFDFAGTVYFGLGENLGADYRLIGKDGTTLSGGGEGGNIYRCRPDGTQLTRVATGFWNPFHVAFDVFGRLFAVDNDPDSRPPCRLLHIVDGGDWVDKSYSVHSKGRIWRLRNARPRTVLHSVTDNGPDRISVATLQSLAGAGKVSDSVIAHCLKSDSADVRALAVRILPVENVDLKTIAASDASPVVRSDAMRRLSDPAAKDVLLKALESEDPFVQQAARKGLQRSLKIDELIALAATRDLAAGRRLGLLLILRDSGRPEASALLPGFLSDPDPLIHFAAIQWVGEHRLEPFRPQLLAGLASSAATRNLFEATLAALEQLDGKMRNPRDEMAGEDYIVALLTDSRTSASVLERGLRMLRPSHPALTLDRLRRFVTGHDAGVAIEAARTLSQSSSPARFAVLSKLALDRNASPALRAEAIVGLADDAVNQRETLLTLASGEQAELRRDFRDLVAFLSRRK